MTTYKKAGVNVSLGDRCSKIATIEAAKTFKGRKGIGKAVILKEGFGGLLDMGGYYLVQTDDGVGTKAEIAEKLGKYETLGYDLLAMVLDDAVCLGTEVFSISNTVDINKVSEKVISGLMTGLRKAALEQKVVIPSGEIAEVGKMVAGIVWNATAVGILEKKKLISGKKIKPGDKIIGLKSRGMRSNGFTLARYILKKKFGANWHKKKFKGKKTWGEVLLTPSLIYHDAILSLVGRYKQKVKVPLKGLAHITGGGLSSKLGRILKVNKLGCCLNNLFRPHDFMLKLQELGNVSDKEAYKSWNMGTGMVVVSRSAEKVIDELRRQGIKAQMIGEVTVSSKFIIKSQGVFDKGKELIF